MPRPTASTPRYLRCALTILALCALGGELSAVTSDTLFVEVLSGGTPVTGATVSIDLDNNGSYDATLAPFGSLYQTTFTGSPTVVLRVVANDHCEQTQVEMLIGDGAADTVTIAIGHPTVTLSLPATVSEGGGPVSGTATLSCPLPNTVTVGLTAGSPRLQALAPVTITAGSTSAPFSVEAVDNVAVDGDVLVPIDAELPPTAPWAIASGSITVQDNDMPPGVIVTGPAGALITDEGGTADSLSVRLASPPSADVEITATVGDPSEGAIGGGASAVLTFTPANWDVDQILSVDGVDDDLVDGDIAYDLGFGVSSADAAYAALSPAPVAVVNEDDEVAMDAVLVLDRSGSMAAPSGASTKIEDLRLAARVFADLLAPEAIGAPSLNRLGLVRYNQTADVYLTPDLLNDDPASGHYGSILGDKLHASATTDTARLQPMGATSIGGGLVEAAAAFGAITSPNPHRTVVLFSDGKHNRAPDVATGKAALAPISDLRIYAVGVGDDINGPQLESIANVTGGFHHVTDPGLVELQTLYFKIFANAAGLPLAVDPVVELPLPEKGPVEVGRMTLTAADREATFFHALEAPGRRALRLELVGPDGGVVAGGTDVGGATARAVTRDNYRILRLRHPGAAGAAAYEGEWVLRLVPEQVATDGVEAAPPQELAAVAAAQTVRVGYGLAVASQLELDLQLASLEDFDPAAPLRLVAELRDRGRPIIGAVRAMVVDPRGHRRSVALNDRGQSGDQVAGDGIYGALYAAPGVPGSYRVAVDASAAVGDQVATRYAERAITLSRVVPAADGGGDQRAERPDGSCVPCALVWIFGFAVVLLLLALCILTCCCRKRC